MCGNLDGVMKKLSEIRRIAAALWPCIECKEKKIAARVWAAIYIDRISYLTYASRF